MLPPSVPPNLRPWDDDNNERGTTTKNLGEGRDIVGEQSSHFTLVDTRMKDGDRKEWSSRTYPSIGQA